MYPCQKCGMLCEEEDLFCACCGIDLRQQREMRKAQKPKRNHFAGDMEYYVNAQSAYHQQPTYYSPNSSIRILDDNQPSAQSSGGYGMGVASLVLGLVSLLGCWVFFITIPCAILAIVFGGVQNSKRALSGMATSGIVLGIISLSLGVMWFLWILVIGT